MNSLTIVLAFALIAMASAGALSYAKRSDGKGDLGGSHSQGLYDQGQSLDSYGQGHKDYFHYPKYKFEYGVKDHHTGK